MAEIRIPLDPLNPGQFFACCGLFDLLSCSADQQCQPLAHFRIDEKIARRAEFLISCVESDLRRELRDLKQGTVTAGNDPEPGIAPVELATNSRMFTFDWWLDEFRADSTDLKCWAGQVRSKNLMDELLAIFPAEIDSEQLFSARAMSKSKFGIDPRSAWNALDFGYSPNEHNKDAATYPAVEILGCLGLQAFRPAPKKRTVEYCLWQEDLPADVASLAAFYPWSGLACARYKFEISKRGQSYKFFTFSTLQLQPNKGAA